MSKFLVQEIRSCLCKKGKQPPRAAELSDENLLEVFNRLRRGQNPNAIARHAQETWGFMTNRSSHTAGQAIRKLEKRIAHLTLGGSPSQHTQAPGPVPATSTPSSVNYADVIEIQDRLYFEMQKRTARLLERETSTGVKYRDSAKDLQAASSLGNLLTKMEEFELRNEALLKKQSEDKGKLAAHYQLVERSLDLLGSEKASGLPYQDAAKDIMAISSCAKALLNDRQFKVKNADLITAQKEAKDDLIVKKGFDRIMAKDGGKALSSFLKKLLRELEKEAIPLEEAAEKAGMTKEEFMEKRVLSNQEFNDGTREMTVDFFGGIADMKEKDLDTLFSAFAKIGADHEKPLNLETLKTQTETL